MTFALMLRSWGARFSSAYTKIGTIQGFPGGASGKEPAYQCRNKYREDQHGRWARMTGKLVNASHILKEKVKERREN